MKTFQLNAEARTDLGKKAAKALRKENKIPVVLNGGKLSCSLVRRWFPLAVTARASSPLTW